MRLLVGGGLSAPEGGFTDLAEPGYHAQAGLELAIPVLPVALRGDGTFHRMAAKSPALARNEILGGTLSLVYRLPGVGLGPYFLGGIGSYRLKSGPVDATETATHNGYHGGFGVTIGGPGLEGFAEIRWVRIDGGAATTTLIPLTIGLRL